MTAPKTTPRDHFTGKKNPITKTVYICNDSELAERRDDLRNDLQQLEFRLRAGNTPADIVAEHDQKKQEERELSEQVLASSIKFKFRSIGRKRLDALVQEHPATDKTREELKRGGQDEDALQWDPETFAPALCVASLVEPEGFDMAEIWESEDWNSAELGALFEAALAANTSRRVVQLGNG